MWGPIQTIQHQRVTLLMHNLAQRMNTKRASLLLITYLKFSKIGILLLATILVLLLGKAKELLYSKYKLNH
jgi:hypothetical protein